MGLFGREKAKEEAQYTDPCCGMVITEAQAIGPNTFHGEAYWFCSTECQDQYREQAGKPRSRRDQARSRRERKQTVMP